VIPHLHKFLHKKNYKNRIKETLIHSHRSTQSFCNNNPNKIFTRADKNNITIAINRSHYIKKMKELLNDKMTYSVVNKNSILFIKRNLNNILKQWLYRIIIFSNKYTIHSTLVILSFPKLTPKNTQRKYTI